VKAEEKKRLKLDAALQREPHLSRRAGRRRRFSLGFAPSRSSGGGRGQRSAWATRPGGRLGGDPGGQGEGEGVADGPWGSALYGEALGFLFEHVEGQLHVESDQALYGGTRRRWRWRTEAMQRMGHRSSTAMKATSSQAKMSPSGPMSWSAQRRSRSSLPVRVRMGFEKSDEDQTWGHTFVLRQTEREKKAVTPAHPPYVTK